MSTDGREALPFSDFAASIEAETAFTVLALAKELQARGKDVIELEIGDSPFPTPDAAADAGIGAIREGHTHYGPSLGLPEFRAAAAAYINREHLGGNAGAVDAADAVDAVDAGDAGDEGENRTGVTDRMTGPLLGPEHVIAGPGAKNFEQLFCEAFLDPGDGVLVFSPHFPTYPPNILRRGARPVLSALDPDRAFRPDPTAVRRFLVEDPSPRAIFLNSPHNPTGGVTTREDLEGIAEVIRTWELGGGANDSPGDGRAARPTIAVFSDEPYDQMVWSGRHHTMLEVPGMMDRTVAAYTFSKSFSMSGWRLGFAVSSPAVIQMLGKLTNTSISCVPPFIQKAGIAALEEARDVRDRNMEAFRTKVEILVDSLDRVEGVSCAMPGGSFYAFPSVAGVCNRHGITSHGLALYLLEGADPERGVACLGGECFGKAGAGFLRLSCAQPDERMAEAVQFMAVAFADDDAVAAYLERRPECRLEGRYVE